jgi:hypothetical protein
MIRAAAPKGAPRRPHQVFPETGLALTYPAKIWKIQNKNEKIAREGKNYRLFFFGSSFVIDIRSMI